jgi:hypothetical protein
MNKELTERLEELKNNYYQDNQKKMIFKNAQKKECAKNICNNMDINILLQNTFITYPNTHIIYVQYTIFKTYANDNNIVTITNYLFSIIRSHVNKYGGYEMHINLDTYTITAHERYRNMYSVFFDMCNKDELIFSDKLIKMYVYNCPSVINTLHSFFSSFIDKNAIHKITMYDKKNSTDHHNKLLQFYNIKIDT